MPPDGALQEVLVQLYIPDTRDLLLSNLSVPRSHHPTAVEVHHHNRVSVSVVHWLRKIVIILRDTRQTMEITEISLVRRKSEDIAVIVSCAPRLRVLNVTCFVEHTILAPAFRTFLRSIRRLSFAMRHATGALLS